MKNNEQYNNQKAEELIAAIKKNDNIEEVKKLVDELVDINNDGNITPLMHVVYKWLPVLTEAARAGRLEVVKYIFEQVANKELEILDEFLAQWTIFLYDAATEGHLDVVEYIFEKGISLTKDYAAGKEAIAVVDKLYLSNRTTLSKNSLNSIRKMRIELFNQLEEDQIEEKKELIRIFKVDLNTKEKHDKNSKLKKEIHLTIIKMRELIRSFEAQHGEVTKVEKALQKQVIKKEKPASQKEEEKNNQGDNPVLQEGVKKNFSGGIENKEKNNQANLSEKVLNIVDNVRNKKKDPHRNDIKNNVVKILTSNQSYTDIYHDLKALKNINVDNLIKELKSEGLLEKDEITDTIDKIIDICILQKFAEVDSYIDLQSEINQIKQKNTKVKTSASEVIEKFKEFLEKIELDPKKIENFINILTLEYNPKNVSRKEQQKEKQRQELEQKQKEKLEKQELQKNKKNKDKQLELEKDKEKEANIDDNDNNNNIIVKLAQLDLQDEQHNPQDEQHNLQGQQQPQDQQEQNNEVEIMG